jgi:hypothetical protein
MMRLPIPKYSNLKWGPKTRFGQLPSVTVTFGLMLLQQHSHGGMRSNGRLDCFMAV